jgi:hypothetical protein
MNDLQGLIEFLCSPVLVHRTALWLVPLTLLGKEPDEASKFAMDAADMAQAYAKHLPNDTLFLGLSVEKFIKTLDTICAYPDKSECIFVFNLDLLLSRLTQKERGLIWDLVYKGFPHRPRALLLMMPETAHFLLPNQEQINFWKESNRYVIGNH